MRVPKIRCIALQPSSHRISAVLHALHALTAPARITASQLSRKRKTP